MGKYDEFPLINIEDGLKRMMGNKKLFIKLLNSYTGNNWENDFIEALKGRDMEKSLMAAHAVKGIAANLSLMRLKNCVTDIEVHLKDAAKNGSDTVFDEIDMDGMLLCAGETKQAAISVREDLEKQL